MTQTPVTDEPVEVPPAPQPGLRDAFNEYVARVRGGDVGPLPAILGLAVLLVIFSVLRPDTFTNSFNFANLLIQSAPVIVIAMGLVFVLLLGEIDLSAGYTAGVAGAVLGVVSTTHDKPWYIGVLACLATGAVIGLVIGVLVARVGIPSFVVTLARRSSPSRASCSRSSARAARSGSRARPCWRSWPRTCRSGSAGRCSSC